MEKEQTQPKPISKISILEVSKYTALTLAALALVLVTVPQIRSSLKGFLKQESRVILSTALGDVTGAGQEAKIVKVETPNGLFIEVYQIAENELELIDRIELKNAKDGYFMFDGEASNLVLEDVDRDSVVEILAPSYDENLIAHLNIYSFDKSRSKFIKLN